MNRLLKNFTKFLDSPLNFLSKNKHILLIVAAVIVFIIMLSNYSSDRNKVVDTMNSMNSMNNLDKKDIGVAEPSNPQTLSNQYEKVSNHSSLETDGLPPSCNVNSVPDPSELLPKDENNQWSRLNPAGAGDLENINLLKAGYHAGIDTVGSSLRNANLQVRSEPPNPTNKVSPWLNSTIEPDLMRQPLEIGCGPQ